MERNLDNLSNELKGRKTLHRDNERANEALGKSLAGAIALLDSRADADAFCAVIRERMKRRRRNDRLIDGCDTISTRGAGAAAGEARDHPGIVGELPDSLLARISDPVQRERLRTVRDSLPAQKPVAAGEAPPSLLDRFRERDGRWAALPPSPPRAPPKLEIAQNLAGLRRRRSATCR